MKKKTNVIIVGMLMGILLFTNGNAQDYQKLAQTSFKFLNVSSDARGAAMAEAMTSLQMGSSALFYNPAGMSMMDNFIDVTASNNQWIDDIKHYTVSMAINPAHGNYGVLGFSLQYVDYGNFIGRQLSIQKYDKGYDDVGIFKLYALALGVGYAKSISDQFSVGGQYTVGKARPWTEYHSQSKRTYSDLCCN